jgi:hypothetical protein
VKTMFSRYVYLATALAGAFVVATPAGGAIVFEFGQPQYDVAPGQTVDVPVSLRFDGADADALVSSGGLLSAAVKVTQTAVPPAGTATVPIAVSPNAADFNDPVLIPIISLPTATSAGVWEFADLTGASGVVGQLQADGSRLVPLGSISFRGGTGVGVTSFSAGRYDPALETTVTFNAPSATLDGVIQGATVSVNVPEPVGCGGILLTIAMIAGRRRSRRSRFIPRTIPWPSPANAAAAARPTTPSPSPA